MPRVYGVLDDVVARTDAENSYVRVDARYLAGLDPVDEISDVSTAPRGTYYAPLDPVDARTDIWDGAVLVKATAVLDPVDARTEVDLLSALDPTGTGPLPGDPVAIGVSGNPPIGIGFGLAGTVALTSLAPDA